MPNKNDKSDLVQFFTIMAAIVAGFVWLLSWGWARAAKEYGDDAKKIDARITEFAREKWNMARRK